MWIAFGIAVVITLIAVGCAQGPALQAQTDFSVSDPQLERALRSAAKAWADAGLLGAQIITINEVDGALPVKRAPREELHKLCHVRDKNYRGDGCTAVMGEQWSGIFIPDDLVDDARLHTVMLHELGHIFAGNREHIPSGAIAVMTYEGTSGVPTPVDMDFMEKFTPVDRTVS